MASGDTEYSTPDPQPLTMALDTLGVAPEDAYYVGDSTVDVKASYHAGRMLCWGRLGGNGL